MLSQYADEETELLEVDGVRSPVSHSWRQQWVRRVKKNSVWRSILYCQRYIFALFITTKTRNTLQLETVSIAEQLQNRQHAQTPYLGQIWHATVGQRFMLTGLFSSWSVYCVAQVGKRCRNVAISTKLSHFGRLLCDLCPFLYQSVSNLAANSRPMVYAYTPNLI